MTLLALAERIEKALRGTVDDVVVVKESAKIICTASVGKQAFRVTVEELEPDKRQPAV